MVLLLSWPTRAFSTSTLAGMVSYGELVHKASRPDPPARLMSSAQKAKSSDACSNAKAALLSLRSWRILREPIFSPRRSLREKPRHETSLTSFPARSFRRANVVICHGARLGQGRTCQIAAPCRVGHG